MFFACLLSLGANHQSHCLIFLVGVEGGEDWVSNDERCDGREDCDEDWEEGDEVISEEGDDS